MSVSSGLSNFAEKELEPLESKEETVSIVLTIISQVLDDDEMETKCICKNYIDQNEMKLFGNKNIFVETELIPNVSVKCIERTAINFIEEDESNEQIKDENNFFEEGISAEKNNLKNIFGTQNPQKNEENELSSNQNLNTQINKKENSISKKGQNNMSFSFDNKEQVKQPKHKEQKIIQIKLKDLLNLLKKFGYPITGSMINIYIPSVNTFVFFGSDPVDSNIYLDSTQINLKYIQMKIINYLNKNLILKANHQSKSAEKDFLDEDSSSEDENDIKYKRTKERKLGYIIEKVHMWRKLYNGFYNCNGEYIRYSLEKAAQTIKVSKKSLDDYLLQLRLGRKYGFDFNKNKNEKVGVLRLFVKQEREKEMAEKSKEKSKSKNKSDKKEKQK